MDTKDFLSLLTDFRVEIEKLEMALKKLRKALENISYEGGEELTYNRFREAWATVVSFVDGLTYYGIYLDMLEEKEELTILLPTSDNTFIKVKTEKEKFSEKYKNLYNVEIRKEMLTLDELDNMKKYYEKGKKIRILILE